MSRRQLSSISITPSILAALTRAGYETLEDLSTTSPEALAKDLKLSTLDVELLFSASRHASTPAISASALPLTQSAASLQAIPVNRFSTRCQPVDNLIDGGLMRGHILELSGPPGTMKEAIAVGVVQSFVQKGEEILFVDTQNMTSPSALDRALQNATPKPSNYKSLVHHVAVNALPELMVFVHNLPAYMDSHPNITLLVLNSISFPFQTPNLTLTNKNALLERIKQTLTKACAMKKLTVVATSQLATKVLNSDGSAGTFDTGSTAVMVPQLGPGYLPSGRTHRLIVHPATRTSGMIRVLSSPTYQPGRGAAPSQPYRLVDGVMQLDTNP
ncbi:hypothetical protein FIBSPDRAFT_942900 [Athelia psychrophila]|uniref:Uncharacterized protein n=1 Tax=Athelia psychrophila TaxID=1759441 RepID=A0A166WI17_9AGAM|nr:hypothetical protein FIBSPDRAFT_942900 [Fibularhizoctonia sp. CBS 109695]